MEMEERQSNSDRRQDYYEYDNYVVYVGDNIQG